MDWYHSEIISQVGHFVRDTLEKEGTGHDWEHCWRVYSLATYICEKEEKGNLFVIQLAAWLHDIKDWKFTEDGNSIEGAEMAKKWMNEHGVDKLSCELVYQIVRDISFKNNIEGNKMINLEGKIVQDADRLEAMGAIGISRVMAYGGFMKRPIHDPMIESQDIRTIEQYKQSGQTSINHFYEKLLKLKDQMHTETAKKLARPRHEYMENFLAQFFREWQLIDIRIEDWEGVK